MLGENGKDNGGTVEEVDKLIRGVMGGNSTSEGGEENGPIGGGLLKEEEVVGRVGENEGVRV